MFYFENRENEIVIVNEMFYLRDGMACKRGRINSRENFDEYLPLFFFIERGNEYFSWFVRQSARINQNFCFVD